MNWKKAWGKGMLAGVLGLVFLQAGATDYKLWYDKPATVWTEALPLGNGRLGAMVFGTPAMEHLQLNEETIWAGQPNSNVYPEAKPWIAKIRELVLEGKYAEAQEIANDKVMLKKNSGMPYQPFGDLYLAFPGANVYTDYYRELSLDSARAVVTYRSEGVNYRREMFTSFPDQVVVVRLTADRPGKITFNVLMTSPHPDCIVASENDCIALSGTTSSHEGVKGKVQFHGRVAVKTQGGSSECRDGVLTVKNADEAILYVSIATNFNNYKDIGGNAVSRAKDVLEQALPKDYKTLKEDHYRYYDRFMGRVDLYLGENEYASLPTDIRVERFARHNDAHLVATYFRFGRYLLIASSQPDGQPANLQGIWNDKLFPSWDSKYTCNINVEMNYWPAEVTQLSELHQPLLKMVTEVAQTGQEAARELYGVDGWVLHHNTDIWRITGPVDRVASGMWPSGGAWLCRHLWEHYLYTGDTAFLRQVYPVLKGAAVFFDQVMIYEPEHRWLVVCPSNSPENTHAGSKNKATIAAGCTLDNQLVNDLWQSVITASEVLNTDHAFATRLQQRLQELPPMQVGRHGQLQEWLSDWDNPEDKHRHVSHLYGVFPSNQISPYRQPELFDAARTSLIHRGDPSTGWSMGWKVCLWARFLDGDHAYKLITDQLTLVRNEKKKGGTYPNLFDAHPPFQIDGNFGCTAGIAEMLMQSHDGCIYLLPALPSNWKEGHVNGLMARGAFEVNLNWKNGQVGEVSLVAHQGGNCRIRSAVPLQGRGLRVAKGENRNPVYRLPQVKTPLVSEAAQLNPVVLQKTYVYDLPTEQGKTYTLKAKR